MLTTLARRRQNGQPSPSGERELNAQEGGGSVNRTVRLGWLDVIAVLALALLPQLYFWRLFPADPMDQKTLVDGDFNQEHFPVIVTVARALREGALPLWNPYSNGGQPLLADPQSALLYPPTWWTLSAITGHDGDSLVALERQIPLHFAMGGIFMYALGRVLFGSRLGAMIAALTFAYCGFLTTYPVQQLPILRALVWLPLQVLGLWLALERRSVPWAVFAGVVLGMAMLAGHPQTVFQEGIVLVVVALVWGYQRWLATRAWGGLRFLPVALMALGLVAVGLSAIQWAPSYEFLRYSNRAVVDYGFVSGGYAFWELPMDLVAPRVLGGLPPYVGIFPMILAGIALILRRNAVHGLAVALGIVGLVLSLGGNSFAYSGAYRVIPGFALFRDQERAIFMFSFGVAILAGSGIALVMGELSRIDSRRLDRFRRALQRGLLGAVAVGAALYVAHVNAEVTAQGFERWREIVNWWFFFVLMLAFSIGILTLRARVPLARGLVAGLAIALVILDLFSVSWDQPLADHFPNDLFRASGIVNRLRSDIGVTRLHDEGVLNGYHGLVYGLPSINKILAMHLDRFDVASERLPQQRLFDLLSVGYITTRQARTDAQLVMQEQWEQFTNLLYRRSNVVDAAWVVPEARIATNGDQALILVGDSAFDPRSQVVLEGIDEAALRRGGTGRVTNYQRTWNDLEAQVSVPQGGYLVFSEIAYPGWRAEVDGSTVPIMTADYLLRAVWLEPGEHTVRMEYRPGSVLFGAGLTLLTLVFLTGYGGMLLRGVLRGRRREGTLTASALPHTIAS